MCKGMNLLEHKSVWFKEWLENIVEKRGLDSTLTVKQVLDMLVSLDGMEKKLDDIIIKTFF